MFAMQMFDILSFIVPIMFIVVFGIIIFSIIQGISALQMEGSYAGEICTFRICGSGMVET